jgi:hypothetical protein
MRYTTGHGGIAAALTLFSGLTATIEVRTEALAALPLSSLPKPFFRRAAPRSGFALY